MANTTPGISVQFDVGLANLDRGLAAAEQKIAQSASRIESKTKVAGSAFRQGSFTRAMEKSRIGDEISDAMDSAVPKTIISGDKAGETYAKSMATSLQRKLAAGAARFALVGAADAMLRGLADGIKENKGMGGLAVSVVESLHEGLKSIPLVGAFSELGEAIGNKMGDGIAAGIVTQATGLGHKIDERGSLTIADIRGRSRSLEISRMGSFDGEAAKFNDEMSRLELENKDNPSVLNEIKAYRERFNADLKSRISESVNAREVAKYREDEADWKAGQEFKRQQQAERDQEAITLKRGQISAVVGERQSKLELIRDMMQGVSRASAEDFVTTAQTAAGSFRTGQRDASRIMADNTKMLVDLQRQENDIVEEIRDHVAELQLLK
jgi:hypothetical protein